MDSQKPEVCVLTDSGWLAAVGGTVVSTGRPTCTQNGSASELDFAVFSRHWTGIPKAELYEDFVPSPHTAVAFAFPGVLPVVSVEVLQRPQVFPAAHSYGPEPQPVPEQDVVDFDLGCNLDAPVLPRDVIRRSFGAKWMELHVPTHWYGVRSRPASQAAWTRLVAARYAKLTGNVAVAILYDVTKAFDNISRFFLLKIIGKLFWLV